jgi:hypothetical protein
MERAREEVAALLGELRFEEEDVISYALFPQVAGPFLERRARGGDGKEPLVAAIAGLLLEQAATRRAADVELRAGAPSRMTHSPWKVGWRPGKGRWMGLLAGSGGGR